MISRRHLLRAGGLAALGTAWPGGVLRAAAETAAPPRRLVLISHCHGWPYADWRMRPPGMRETRPWSLDLTPLTERDLSAPLAPLHPHRRRLLVLDGLSLATAELDAGGNRHDRGWIHAWTGNNADFSERDTRSRSASLDQLVAAHVARPDRLPSLELSVDAALEAGRPIAYNLGRRAAAGREHAVARLGAGVRTGLVRRRGRRAPPHDSRLRVPRVPGGRFRFRRRRSDPESSPISDSSTGSVGGWKDSRRSPATAPPRPAAAFEQYDRRFDAFTDIIAAAFGCDITRVVSLSLGEMPTAEFGADHISDKVHKGIAHYIYDDAAKHAAMADYVRHHARQVARLVSTLETIPDAGGGSVMDNTLIVWGSELGDGWHGYSRYNPVLIGGSWAFRTGRYLYWPHRTPVQMRVPSHIAPSGRTRFAGVPHQRMLVSVARAMGLPVDHVGLRQVRGQRGDFVDVSGPLDLRSA